MTAQLGGSILFANGSQIGGAEMLSGYKTQQRKLIYTFFENHPDDPYCAGEIAAELSTQSSISLSAVYRNLAVLAEKGQIRRLIKDVSREVFYQFIRGECCLDSVHLTCTECGKTFHMSKPVADFMQDGLSKTDGFQLDKVKTVLYGVCKRCC